MKRQLNFQKKILLVGLYPNKAACTRLRLFQIPDYIDSTKWVISKFTTIQDKELDSWISGGFKRLIILIRIILRIPSLIQEINDSNLIFIQREILPLNILMIEKYIKRKKKTIIYLILLSLSATVFARVLTTPDTIISSRGSNPTSINIFNGIYVLISDWARVKAPIRSPLESINSLGVYLIIVLAIWALIVSTKRNIKPIKFISILTIVFGLTLQTGIGEFAVIKGRIGWYFMFTSALLLSLIFDQTKIQLSKKIRLDAVIGLSLILNFIIVIFNLPDAYRKDNENILIEMKKIIAKDNRSQLYVYSDMGQLKFVSEKVTVMQNFTSQKIDYFVLNNETQIPDFNLANIRAYEDRNVDKFNDLQLLEINKRLEKNKAIFNYAMRLGYSVVIKEREYTIIGNKRF
jgi:hypothetical protein